jgi:hypothetical protein
MLSTFLIEGLCSGHDLLDRTSMNSGAKLVLKFLHTEDNYRSFRLSYKPSQIKDYYYCFS